MNKVSILLAAVMLVVLSSGIAQAQCLFDEPAVGKSTRSAMTKAYASCPGITFLAPNTQTMVGTPACTTPFPISPFLFSQLVNSRCTVSTRQKEEIPCSDGSGVPCANVKIKASCFGILEPDGITPTSAPGWALNTVARATFDDADGGDMTVIDFPAQFAFPQAKNGKFKLSSDTNALLFDLFGAGSALPLCTGLQTISAAIADPNGLIFATLGSSTR